MKKLIIGLVTLCSISAFADTLTCYPSYSRNPNPGPVFTANVVSDSELHDITFSKWVKNTETGLSDYSELTGSLNSNNRSPYKGARMYPLLNGDILYLPSKLSKIELDQVLQDRTVRGFNGGENGVIVGNAKDWSDSSGNHYSIRMHCVSDIE